ncbi:unnamed protein product, partial [Linum tenue]
KSQEKRNCRCCVFSKVAEATHCSLVRRSRHRHFSLHLMKKKNQLQVISFVFQIRLAQSSHLSIFFPDKSDFFSGGQSMKAMEGTSPMMTGCSKKPTQQSVFVIAGTLGIPIKLLLGFSLFGRLMLREALHRNAS